MRRLEALLLVSLSCELYLMVIKNMIMMMMLMMIMMMINREHWMEEAEECEKAGSVATCQSIM